jgi:hypothetical protein
MEKEATFLDLTFQAFCTTAASLAKSKVGFLFVERK